MSLGEEWAEIEFRVVWMGLGDCDGWVSLEEGKEGRDGWRMFVLWLCGVGIPIVSQHISQVIFMNRKQ